MINLPTKIPSNTWISTTWQEYIQVTANPDYQKAKFYYHQRKFLIEMPPLGNDHASDHTIVTYAINLYAALKDIALNGKDNCTYRKTGYQDAQPDLSYYIGETVDAIPYGTTIVDLDNYPPPTLVIEIANTSLADDQGAKRLLYEDLGVKEYWIVDVQCLKNMAFRMANNGSFRIKQSQVLPELNIALLEDALGRTRHSNHSQVGAWLIKKFQQ